MTAISERETATDTYAVSPMQAGMLFHHLLEPDSGADIEQMVMRFDERVDRCALVTAWDAVAARHAVLRTSFTWGDDRPRQCVHASVPTDVTEIDHTVYTEAQSAIRLAEFLVADRRRGFDLGRAPLSRMTVVHHGPEVSTVIWSFHHVILDGRSFPIVVEDLFAAYDAVMTGTDPDLGPGAQ